ncbi:MAG: hypothetical protein KDK97_14645 [Verrucomicrobiales bacterium]|nr:hypothetical protein [Verrucomicrobiales bacterium]MCP5556291.1 hypothetical protein [Verrucomicrobiaceae bacterium]
MSFLRFGGQLFRFGVLLIGGSAAYVAVKSAAPVAEHDLTLNWVTGKQYVIETSTTTTMGLETLGRIGDQVVDVKQSTSIAVRPGPEAGWKAAKVSIDAMAATMKVEGRTMTFDSAKPLEGDLDLRQAMAGSVGQSFVLLYDDKDQFQRVGDLSQAANITAGSGSANLMSLTNAQQMAELFRRSMEMALPLAPVGPGDTWTSDEKIAFPQAGDMSVKMTCKFDSLVDREGRPHAKIVFESKLATVAKSATAGVRQISLDEGSTVAGHIFFDLERRTVSLSVFLANLNLNLDGNKIPVRQNVTTKLESWTNLPAAP